MKIDVKLPEYIRAFACKYKYPLRVFLFGIIFVLIGGNNEKESVQSITPAEGNNTYLLEQQLEDMIEKIDGVGRAEVILSLKYSEQNIYAKEEVKENASEIVIVNENGAQKALVEYTSSPEYKGALIVCDGGDDSKVRLEITDAVKALTGISSQNIIITKMKK